MNSTIDFFLLSHSSVWPTTMAMFCVKSKTIKLSFLFVHCHRCHDFVSQFGFELNRVCVVDRWLFSSLPKERNSVHKSFRSHWANLSKVWPSLEVKRRWARVLLLFSFCSPFGRIFRMNFVLKRFQISTFLAPSPSLSPWRCCRCGRCAACRNASAKTNDVGVCLIALDLISFDWICVADLIRPFGSFNQIKLYLWFHFNFNRCFLFACVWIE